MSSLADRLRAHPFVNDAEVMTGPNPGEVTVFLAPQGFRPGPELRDIVLGLVDAPGPWVQVVVGWAVPRGPDGQLDREAALAALDQPGAVFRFEPPDTAGERMLASMVQAVLPDVRLSMTDDLASLGGDSLTAVDLVVRIREGFGVEVDPQQVFDAESLRELAAALPVPGQPATSG